MEFSIGTVLSSYVHQMKHEGVSLVTCNSLDSSAASFGEGRVQADSSWNRHEYTDPS